MKKSLMDYDISKKIDITQEYINEYKKSLAINIDKLTEVDGYAKWRERESLDLSNLVQDRFRFVYFLLSSIFFNFSENSIFNIITIFIS